MPRFLLDENLPPRAAELMSLFGFPMLAVGGLAELPRGTTDIEIARWCGENDVVWMTLDRGILKDREIAAAIVRWRTSILLLPVKGMRMRDHLALLVSRFDRIEQTVERERVRGRAFRFRMTKRGSLTPIDVSVPKIGS